MREVSFCHVESARNTILPSKRGKTVKIAKSSDTLGNITKHHSVKVKGKNKINRRCTHLRNPPLSLNFVDTF